MNGTVTISLEDFDKLRNAGKEALDAKTALTQAAKELEVFLSFMVTRENLTEYIDEFNRQSTKSQIVISSGRAKIKINGIHKD